MDLIENNKNTENNNERKIYLGRFVRFIGLRYASDTIDDAKAEFEYGTILKGHYMNVFALPN